jgi:hypothetical protein
MKKLLLLSLVLFSFTVSYAQSFLRASGLVFGIKSAQTGVVKWDDPISVNLLAKLETSKVTIYSKTVQEYRIISMTSKTDNMTTWYCSDHNGKTCNFSLFTTPDKPGSYFLYVEYNDAVWMYISKPE